MKDNMDLLELALKRSIDWSIKIRPTNRNDDKQPDNHLIDFSNQTKSIRSSEKGAEFVQSKVYTDSHIRAFITHFKIQLNHLMGIKWTRVGQLKRRSNNLSQDLDENSSSERDSLDTEDLEPLFEIEYASREGRKLHSSKPKIKMNGKYSGVYSLNDQSDDDDDDDDDRDEIERSMRRNCEHCGHQRSIDEDGVDDGYRSLSRDSIIRTNLLQQLNDIRSRVVDLVDEIDTCVSCRLDKDEVEAYRRRRDALVLKLDTLIENQKTKFSDSIDQIEKPLSVSEGSAAVSTKPLKSIKESNVVVQSEHTIDHNDGCELNRNSDDYEEQVRVIDYDSDKKSASSDASGSSNGGSLDCRNLNDLGQKFSGVTSSAYINNINSIYKASIINDPTKLAPIDFGALMENYENNKSREQQNSTDSQDGTNMENKMNSHTPTSSSTSTCSSISNASSSSFI